MLEGSALPSRAGGSREPPPRNFFEDKLIYAIFKIIFLVISYLAELFIFEWFVQIRVYIPGLFLSGFYRSEHIPGLNCREKFNTFMYLVV